MHYFLDVLKKYAIFDGRAARKEFWMFFLINLIIMIVLAAVDNAAGLVDESGYGVLGGIYSLAVLLPTLAVAVRRLHDTGRSGYYILLGFIPLVGAIILIVFYAQDGQAGANKYGPNPKGANPPGAVPTTPAAPAPKV